MGTEADAHTAGRRVIHFRYLKHYTAIFFIYDLYLGRVGLDGVDGHERFFTNFFSIVYYRYPITFA
jgi:hypothetical protein